MQHLTEVNPANFLILAGIVFLAVGVFGKVGGYLGSIFGRIEAGEKARVLSGVLGVALLITGVVMHSREAKPTPTGTVQNSSKQKAQTAATGERTYQNEWRWCHKCQGLFFSGNPSQGVCPADNQAHDGSQSGQYAAVSGDDAQGQQAGWRWCHKCQGMFFSGNPSQGVCPVDKQPHDGSQSGHYAMTWVSENTEVSGMQAGWRWCRKCQGFFFAGNPDQGACPAGGKHDGSASARYAVPLAQN